MAKPEYRDALPSGTVLRGLYRVERVLGKGGYALTYLGSHTGLDQKVAIKEYLPDQFAFREEDHNTVRPRVDAGDEYEHGLKRFAEEARTLAKFKHPGIVPVTDIFEENATAYMVMEYVEGESLQQRLARTGTLDEPDFRAIFEPILEALDEVHGHGILHRDIKPENIYLRADGSPVLLDFGNSREAFGPKAQSLTVALTPGYAPSEQYSSRGKQGPWTDIYSLGATMYAAVTGERPSEASDRALDDDYIPAGQTGKGIEGRFSAALLGAIDQALAVRPYDRPQTIAALRDCFDGTDEDKVSGPHTIVPAAQAARGGANPSSPRARRPNASKAARSGRPWRCYAIAASVVLLLAAGGGAVAWMKHRQAVADQHAAAAERARLAAVARARAEAGGRREAARFERAADQAEQRANEAARRDAWLREQREKAEQRRKSEERRQRPRKEPPRCRDVGGYEAYMKRTGKVCML